MTKIVLTGAGGFLGFHVRAAALEQGVEIVPVKLGESFNLKETKEAIEGSARLIHLAGVNRGTDEEVTEGNISFAEQLAQALREVENPPSEIVYANSIQAGNGTNYGLSLIHI